MTLLIDGKKTAQDIKNEIAARVAEIKQAGGKQPHLAAILVEKMVPAKPMWGPK